LGIGFYFGVFDYIYVRCDSVEILASMVPLPAKVSRD